MKWWNAVLPVLTLVIGYLGTIATEELQHGRARRLAKEEREDALSATQEAERRAFELETLKAMQAAIADLGRAAGKVHHFDLMKAQELGVNTYPNTQLPAGLGDEEFEAIRRVRSLLYLVMDGEAREAIEAFTAAVAHLGIRTQGTVEEAQRDFAEITESFGAAQRLVGARIRGIYEGTVTTS